jgi:antitoxin HigA-1
MWRILLARKCHRLAFYHGYVFALKPHELGISQAQFARAIGVSPMRVSHIVRGTRPVTAEMALLLGRALGQSPQYWLNLQAAYDLKAAEAAISKQLQTVTELAPA